MFEYLRNKILVAILLIIFLGIFFQFALDVIFSLIYRNHALVSPFLSYVISSFITLLVFLGLMQLSKSMNKKYSWERAPRKRYYLQMIFATVLIVVLVNIIRTGLNLIFTPDSFIRLLDEVVISVFFIFMGILLVSVDIGINMQYKWRNSLAEIERYKKENLRTQFEMLRMQVNPHFLFNSLNTLSSLIYQSQDTASDFVKELSAVYRYMLDNRQKDLVSLKEELEFTKSYIFLMKIRFDKKLIFEIDTDTKFENLQIVPLTLQILIENAIKHNIVSAKKPLNIEIKIIRDNIIVRNKLQKKTGDTYSSGIGLDNIKNRLSILTDKKPEVIENKEYFEVKVPLLNSSEITSGIKNN